MVETQADDALALNVAGLGRVRVVAPTDGAAGSASWRFRRPLRTDYAAFTDYVVASWLQPPVAPARVGQLAPATRRRLMNAVLRRCGGWSAWRALYGSHLSRDERFFAAMVWDDRRARLSARLRNRRAMQAALVGKLSGVAAAAGTLGPARPSAALLATALAKSPVLAGTTVSSLAAGLGWSSALQTSLKAVGPAEHVRGRGWSVPKALLAGHGGGQKSVGLTGALGLHATALADHVRGAALLSASGRPLASASLLQASGVLGVEVPRREQWMLAVRKLASGKPGFADEAFLTSKHLLGAAGLESMWRVGPLTLQLTKCMPFGADIARGTLDIGTRVTDLGQPWRRLADIWAEVAAFVDAWEEDPLWYLLNLLSMAEARQLVGLGRSQVQEVLLTALEHVIRSGRFIGALRETVGAARHLTEPQRLWLDHALDYAQRGEWLQAVLPLMAGLEGAVRSARRESQPATMRRRGKLPGADKLIKQMATDDAYKLFAVRLVFGGTGHSFRHGDPTSEPRQLVLFAVVALSGWLDATLNVGATRALASQLAGPLMSSAERCQQLPR